MKLLIADDEAVIRRGMERMISSFQYDFEILTARDGAEALEVIRNHKPQLILADINMPHINGLDMISQARELVPESKIIIISGYHEFDYAQKAMELKVSEYLLKPVKEAQLRSVLQKACASYRQRQQELKLLNMLAPQESADIIAQMIEEMKQKFSDESLCLQVLAEKFHVSQSYLSRGLKQRIGMGFSDYLNSLRLEKAKLLLLSSINLTILEVSLQAGFSSQHYFCRVFRQTEGVSPTEYRSISLSN